MSNEEITEITLVVKPKRPPSFWANLSILVLLFAALVTTEQISEKMKKKALEQMQEAENHIVLEDHEGDKAMATPEPEALQMPQPTPQPEPPKKKSKTKKISRKKSVKPKITSASLPPDPYTGGGELDLDSEASRQTYKDGNVILVPKEATAGRDEFIPFEE